MWTPATAVLWECWRLSRRSLAILMLTAAFGGAALIVSPLDGDWSARLALVLAGFLALCGQAWAQNLDSRTGFTMRLGFTRPIPTWVSIAIGGRRVDQGNSGVEGCVNGGDRLLIVRSSPAPAADGPGTERHD